MKNVKHQSPDSPLSERFDQSIATLLRVAFSRVSSSIAVSRLYVELLSLA